MRKPLLITIAVIALLNVALLLLGTKIGAIYRHPLVAMKFIAASPEASLPVPVQGIHPRQLADTWGGPGLGGRQHRHLREARHASRQCDARTRLSHPHICTLCDVGELPGPRGRGTRRAATLHYRFEELTRWHPGSDPTAQEPR